MFELVKKQESVCSLKHFSLYDVGGDSDAFTENMKYLLLPNTPSLGPWLVFVGEVYLFTVLVAFLTEPWVVSADGNSWVLVANVLSITKLFNFVTEFGLFVVVLLTVPLAFELSYCWLKTKKKNRDRN